MKLASNCMHLPEECDTAWAMNAQDALAATGALSADFTIDGAEVTRMTTTGVQLLLSLSRSLAAEGGHLALVNAGPAIWNAFTELGLADTLKQWGAE